MSNADTAFDWRGFRPEQTLLEEYFTSYKKLFPDWDAAVHLIGKNESLESFCHSRSHRLPSHFYQDPKPRAHRFIERYFLESFRT